MTRIVSKRLGSLYRFGRADCWLKVKNPAAAAVTRGPRRIGTANAPCGEDWFFARECSRKE
jgi:hypothetical protein